MAGAVDTLSLSPSVQSEGVCRPPSLARRAQRSSFSGNRSGIGEHVGDRPHASKRPPCRPAPGPISTASRPARITVSSCSTTMTVLPRLQAAQGVKQALRVARMQAHGRLVEDVADAEEAAAEVRRQAGALGFAAGEGRRGPVEREIAEADLVQETKALGDFAQQQLVRRDASIGPRRAAQRTLTASSTTWR